MKIDKIRFYNIHSLRGEHEIEFSSGVLAEAGLFAITGPTGSGKSTLLDVITLALFGKIPRMDKTQTKNLIDGNGAVMTRNAKSCFAEVEYSVNGCKYRSSWSIERNRNNNLNSRKQELSNVETGEIIKEGKDVPDKNTELIGLNYDQFVKAIVLSQGQFSRMLKAPRDERNKLLEDITGAGHYRRIGKAVFYRYREAETAVKEQEIKLGEIKLLDKEELEKLESELKSLNESIPNYEKQYNVFKSAIEVRRKIDDWERRKHVYQNEVDQYKLAYDAFGDNRQRLNVHDRLVVHRDKLLEYDKTKHEAANLASRKNRLETELANNRSNRDILIGEIEEFTGERVKDNEPSKTLNSFRDRVQALTKKEDDFKGQLEIKKQAVTQGVESLVDLDIQIQSTIDSPEAILKEFKNHLIKADSNMADSNFRELDLLQDEIKRLRENADLAAQLMTKSTQYEGLQDAKERVKGKILASQKIIEKLKPQVPDLEKKVASLQAEVADLEELESQRQRILSLDERRNDLKEGEPCPLCGSDEHPFVRHKPIVDTKKEILRSKKELLSSIIQTLAGKRQEIESQTSLLASYSEEFKSNKTRLKELSEELSTLVNGSGWEVSDRPAYYEEKKEQINQSVQKLKAAENSFKSKPKLEKLIEWTNELIEIDEKYLKTKGEREKLYLGSDIIDSTSGFAQKLTQLETRISEINKNLDVCVGELKNSTAKTYSLKNQVDAKVLSEGLNSIEELREGILDEEKATQFRKEESTLSSQKATIEERGKTLDSEEKELRAKDDPDKKTEELEVEFVSAKDRWDESRNRLGTIQATLKREQDEQARVRSGKEKLELLQKDLGLWTTMKRLIGDAEGKVFSNFVQDLTLEQLIMLSNNRLKGLNDRYILDAPTSKEADKNDSLKVIDTHMGDVRRSVDTLSGGETFLISLAMAFALSDLASKNVKIESLFIDEGFGTLDSETLDQAITILEKMQTEGDKSIGVISHVSELKERITTQIQLEKSSAGYSTLSIVQ